MSTIHPAWIERQRRLRPDGQRWMRHDVHRFAAPSVQTKSFAAHRIEQRRAAEEAALDAELSAFQIEHLALRRELAELKYELAWRVWPDLWGDGSYRVQGFAVGGPYSECHSRTDLWGHWRLWLKGQHQTGCCPSRSNRRYSGNV
jgi:hypothetical protein